ncbi:MAG: hypothetical protein RLZZ283_317 [Candidatus Parcubacteria bacterium]|jgi:hypothetical protein
MEKRPIIGPGGTLLTTGEALNRMRELRREVEMEGVQRVFMHGQLDPEVIRRRMDELNLIETQLGNHLKKITRRSTRH